MKFRANLFLHELSRVSDIIRHTHRSIAKVYMRATDVSVGRWPINGYIPLSVYLWDDHLLILGLTPTVLEEDNPATGQRAVLSIHTASSMGPGREGLICRCASCISIIRKRGPADTSRRVLVSYESSNRASARDREWHDFRAHLVGRSVSSTLHNVITKPDAGMHSLHSQLVF